MHATSGPRPRRTARATWSGTPPPVAAQPREQADGLPVPIVPGTRVTEAEVRPPAPPIPPVPPRPVVVISHGQAPKPAAPTRPAPSRTIVIKGQISATMP